jgi:hypothetical protein
MSDWIDLNIDTIGVDKRELHTLVCKSIISKENYCIWIADVNLDVKYKVFDCMLEMCEYLWYNWPANKIEEFYLKHRISEEIPAILAEYSEQYYLLETKELAEEFLETSRETVSNNDE